MKLMSLFNSHQHYWGIPHIRSNDNRLVQTCYECGAERKVKAELRPDFVINARESERVKAA